MVSLQTLASKLKTHFSLFLRSFILQVNLVDRRGLGYDQAGFQPWSYKQTDLIRVNDVTLFSPQIYLFKIHYM